MGDISSMLLRLPIADTPLAVYHKLFICLARGNLTVDNFLNSANCPCSGVTRQHLARLPAGRRSIIKVLCDSNEMASGEAFLLGY